MRAVQPLDPRRNSAWLKLELFCRGLRLHESCLVEEDGGRPLLRTRAGLGSGLELILPGGLFANVPVLEGFAAASPYELRRQADARGRVRYQIQRDGAPCAWVRPASRPAWYDARTATGKPMRRIATLQGTVLAIYAARVCDFWVTGPDRSERESCRFCSVGINIGVDDDATKTADEVLEVVHAARAESRVTYVDFNMGHDDQARYLDTLEPLVRRVKDETGLLVGVQTPPWPDPSAYARFRRLGVNRVSFCFEVFDRDAFAATCPGKARVYGLDGYLRAIETCTSLPAGSAAPFEPWVVNGEIIAGLEPPESSIAAIRWLTDRGATPTVCVFRPLKGTPLEHRPPPDPMALLPVFEALYLACTERGLPIGVAPNVHVSLVLLPEECRALVRDPAALVPLRGRERVRALQRGAFAVAFRARLGLRRAGLVRRAQRLAVPTETV